MTKKEEKNQDENILEEALKKVQQEKIDQEDSFCDQEKDELIQKIALLEKEKQEALDIASKVQYDYVNLKTDFDRVQRLSLEKEKTMESDFLMKYIKKILPIVDLMKSSLNHIDESKKDDPFVKGVMMTYDNLLKIFESLSVFPIESLGLAPDSFLHEPLSTIPVEDKNQKGKIVQVFQQGFYLEKNGEKIVIVPSKVVVGA